MAKENNPLQPFGELLGSLGKEIGNIISPKEAGTTVPAINIIENGDSLEVEVAAPGRRKTDFVVNIDAGVLSISAQAPTDLDKNYKKREFTIGEFKRRFSVDSSIDPQLISAKYEEGILRILLPKKESEREDAKGNVEIW